jgi:hypothetical protein
MSAALGRLSTFQQASKLATNATKKALFAKLAEHHRALAREIQQAIAASSLSPSD